MREGVNDGRIQAYERIRPERREIEARAKEWEDGTWKGELVELRAGRLRLSPWMIPHCVKIMITIR